MIREWNPRYVAYADAHGKTPDQMLAHDKAEHPGGCMMEFMFWIGARWREWDRLNGHADPGWHSSADHVAFDGWLLNYGGDGEAD